MNGGTWNEERVLERYELLFEAGLIPEARGNPGPALPNDPTGVPMAFDHRRCWPPRSAVCGARSSIARWCSS
ncbi:hypothetical protein ACU4GR_33320 [Methylobacterium oryzae CBMB20]